MDQGIFVPMQTCCTLITNMVTGLIIWQDLNTLGDNLFVYVIMHLIMLLGIWLLAPEDAIQQYKASEGRSITLTRMPNNRSRRIRILS